MATKKLIIEAEVNTEQLDKATAKLGELKKLSNKISIQYDIDGKPLDVVIDKTLNLQQQVKVLTSELRKTKEGSAEFTLLSSKLNNTKDDLARVNTKSRELFATFALIPGPIGEIFGKLNGVIGLLKTFSGFSVKDFGNQFKEFGKDIDNIYNAIFGLNKQIDQTTNSLSNNTSAQQDNSDVQQDNTDSIDEGTTATNAGTVANNQQTDSIKKQQVEYVKATANIDNYTQVYGKLVDAGYGFEIVSKEVNDAVEITGANITDLDGKTKFYTTNQIGLIDVTKDLTDEVLKENNAVKVLDKAIDNATKQTKALSVAEEIAIFTTNALNIALKAIGIGFIIALVAGLVDGLIELGKYILFSKDKFEDFTNATKKGNLALEEAKNRVSEVGVAFEQAAKGTITKQKALEVYNSILGGTIGQAKTLEEAERLYKENTANYIKATGLRAEATELYSIAAQKAAKALSGEDIKTTFWEDVGNSLLSLGNVTKMATLSTETSLKKSLGFVDESNKLREKANKLTEEALKLEVKYKPKTDDKKPDIAKIENDNKAANALLLKLKQENSVNILNEERKKQDAQLKIDKENEEREINNLKLSKDKEELRAKLLEQIRVKYGLKVIDLNKKRQEEDNKSFDESQKKIKEYNDKVFEIMNAADESEIGRNKATLERKYRDDVDALQKDTEFQKQSKIEQERILTLLEKAKNQAIQKLDDDDAQNKRDKNLKRLDDELKFLQIRGDALIEGTKRFYDNQRAILKTAEKKELADLEDRAIKEVLTEQQIADAKEEIRKKYLKMAKDITQQELQNILQAAQATLGVAQTIAQDIGKVAQIEQQVAMEEATKRYIKQNELDKKTITNQEQLDAKLLENKKKFAQEEDDIKRKAFEENKKIQIAQAIIATLQSAVGAFSSLIATPFVGPVIAPIAAAAALVFGYKQVAAIKKTQYQSSLDLSASETSGGSSSKTNYGKNYADGGLIGGKRHAQGGTMIEAEQGEAIMTRGAVTQFAPLLSLMNQAGGGTSFNSNLMTTRQDNPILSNPAQEQAPLIVKTYVVSQELTTEAHRQARLKNLSTI